MMSDEPLKVAIVGCGLIGRKRARAMPGGQLVACADAILARASELSAIVPGARAFDDWHKMLTQAPCDVVVVATPNNLLAEITAAAVERGCHVLVEKPGARFAGEIEPIDALARARGIRVRIGFNHRYHRALRKAQELLRSGALGELMFLRARYGHGGRIGYNREWRANPKLSGGGELIDQGAHLVDLARWFLGEFVEVQGFAHTFYWDMPVDDNAFMILRTADDKTAFLHASCTEWKNTFSFEIYGRDGKIDITGLGGSYGTERIAFHRMLPEMGPPETTIWEYPMEDDSWAIEFANFVEDIRVNRSTEPGVRDAVAVLRIIEQVYKDSGYDHRP
jgi:predicted dehydrogenase